MLKSQLEKFGGMLRGIDRIYEDYAKQSGLTFMSLRVLDILFSSEKPCTQRDVCEISRYNKQVVNAIIKGFQKKGYITLCEDSEDRRNKHLSFTEAGQSFARGVIEPLRQAEKNAMLAMSYVERESFIALFEKCYEGYLTAASDIIKDE